MWISFLVLLLSPEDVGDYLSAKSHHKKALAVYRMVHREIPSSRLRLKIGLSSYATGNKADAAYWLSKTRALKPRPCSPFSDPVSILRHIYFDNGMAALAEGNINSALSWFKRAEADYGLAFVRYQLGDSKKAEQVFSRLGNSYALGVINYSEGAFDKALECFRKTGDAKQMGACLYRMERYPEALHYFEQAGDLFFAAECYYELGRFKESEEHYRRYLRSDNDLAHKNEALYGVAWSCHKQEEFSKSAAEFSRFAVQYPEDDLRPVAVYYAGRSFLKAREFVAAITIFRNFISEYPQSEFIPNSYYWLAKAYFAESDYGSCIQTVGDLVITYPEHELCQYAYSLLGTAHCETGNYDSAIVWYDYVQSPAWLLDEARFRMEECHYELGKYANRIDILSNFVRKYPESSRAPRLAFEIGKHHDKEGSLRRAVTAFNKVVHEFSWSLYANRAKLKLADCHFRLKEDKTALEIYRGLLKTDVREEALAELADLYFLLTDYEQSIREYALLINEFPESEFAMDAQYRIGLSYEHLGKPSEARLAFRSFIDRYPESPERTLWEAHLKLAKTYWNEGLIDDYENALLDIKDEGKGRIRQESIFLLGSLCYDKGDYESAKIYYLDAFSEYEEPDPKSMALIGAARCAISAGETEEARQFYKKAISLAPNPQLEELAKREIQELEPGLPDSR
jgi:TolA-binding protein